MTNPISSLPVRDPLTVAGLEPMLGLDDWRRLLSVSRRTVESMRSGGRLPKPDLLVGRLPRWRAETIRAGIARGGKP